MWFAICKFEVRSRFKRLETYAFFIFLLVCSFFAYDFIYYGIEVGNLQSSTPHVIGRVMAVLTGFFMMIISMIMGVPVLKDYEGKMDTLLFVNPIKKWEYLLGNYIGSFVILILVFTAVLIGMMLGDLMPWRACESSQSLSLGPYVRAYVVVVLPTLFFGGSIFFVTGMLSRSMLVVYTQGLVFFLFLVIGLKVDHPMISGLLDPFAHIAISQNLTEGGINGSTIAPISFQGVFLYNRLVWCGIGLAFLAYGYLKFSFSSSFASKKPSKEVESGIREIDSGEMGEVLGIPSLNFGLKTSFLLLSTQSLFYFKTLVRKPTFWAIITCGIVTVLVNTINLNERYGVSSYPSTYLILDELKEMSIFFFLLLLGLFSSEVLWRERKSCMEQIVDALPVSDLLMISGKYFGLIASYSVLLLCMFIFGIALQINEGYYDFQVETYAIGLSELWIFLVLFTFISFFFQVLSNSPFIGHILLILFFMFSVYLSLVKYGHGLYNFGGQGLREYSELDGYGDSIYPFLVFKSYWFSFCMVLLAITAVLMPRGTQVRLKERMANVRSRLTSGVKSVIGIASCSMLLLGGFIFYHANVLNNYVSSATKRNLRAGYEKTLKQYEYLPQPKVVEVSLRLDLYPEERNYRLEGSYVLKNLDSVEIEAIHVQTFTEGGNAVGYIRFDRASEVSKNYPTYGYTIHQLEHALAPGDSLRMMFLQESVSQGFTAYDDHTDVLSNGTFLNNDKFPSMGYCSQVELSDRDDRRDFGLASKPDKVERGHPYETFLSRDGDDGVAVRFKLSVSTSEDQIAVGPGTLQEEWKEGGRNFFLYATKVPMINFYAITSARYEVARSRWTQRAEKGKDTVDLEIYYHPTHMSNVDRMMEGMRAALSYCTSAFGPYPYKTLKVAEVTRAFDRAQSFPTLIACSESMGFMMDVDSTSDLNIPFFISAHEVAHQWWGMQLVAANVKGKHLLLESLAHYSAVMTYQAQYGIQETKRLLAYEQVRYQAGKRDDPNPEVPLIDVTDQEHLYYSKAIVELYQLQERMGEPQFNAALNSFLSDWNVKTRLLKNQRFATSIDLVPYIVSNAPDSLRKHIRKVFDSLETETKQLL